MSISSKYTRQPKHYIKLPTQGIFYNEGDIEFKNDEELAVRAMTARDEQLLKNPEALLNGDSIASIIQSCCPEIKMPIMNLISADVEVILLAIMSASYNDKLEFEAKCPSCGHHNEYSTDISKLLNQPMDYPQPPYIVKKEYEFDGNTVIVEFYLSPYTYKQMTRRGLVELEHNRMYRYLSDNKIDEDEKIQKYAKSFQSMVDNTFFSVVECIHHIVTPEGEIHNREEINEFFEELDKQTVDLITERLKEISQCGIDTTFHAKCIKKECGHEWKTRVEMDPARFFVKGYSR